MKAINIYTREEVEVEKIEGRIYYLRFTNGDIQPWNVRDFRVAWRVEGSIDYDRVIRHKRQGIRIQRGGS